MAHKILEEAQEMNDLLIKWRRDLHQIPETDLELPKTVEYISKRPSRPQWNRKRSTKQWIS